MVTVVHACPWQAKLEPDQADKSYTVQSYQLLYVVNGDRIPPVDCRRRPVR